MILYPAIDLKDGLVVRPLKGDLNATTVYSDDPGAAADHWANMGFGWLHVVDLNGAVAGHLVNASALTHILSAAKGRMQVQLGGGIRTLGQIEAWLKAGVSRVILGSIALRNPSLVKTAAQE